MKSCTVFDIQRFSTHDGDGIRTNIFFKGCTLQCPWCSNPESRSPSPELIYDHRLCKNFGECIKISGGAIVAGPEGIVINRAQIHDVESFRQVCPTRALTVAGDHRTIDEILLEIEKDIPFYRNSSGGVTFTGGEPFIQGESLFVLASQLHSRGIHMAVETCLFVSWWEIEKFLNLIDLFLVDIKHTNPEKFKTYTGGDLDRVFNNLGLLVNSGQHVVARIPVIPGFNFTEPELKSIIDLVAGLHGIREIDFIPYHSLGASKYKMLGKSSDFAVTGKVDPVNLQPYVDYANNKGLKVKIGG